MRLIIALILIAVAFAAELEVQSVAHQEPALPFVAPINAVHVNGEALSNIPSPVKIAPTKIPDRQKKSGDSIVQFVNIAPLEISESKIAEDQDVPVAEDLRLPFVESPLLQVDSVKIAVPVVEDEPISEGTRFKFYDDLQKVKPSTVPEIVAVYNAPIAEGRRVQFVEVSSQQNKPVIAPILSEDPNVPVPEDLSVKFVDSEDLPLREDLVLPFLYALSPQANPVNIAVPNTPGAQDESVLDDLRVKFVDASLPASEYVKVDLPEVSKVKVAPLPEDLRAQNVNAPLPQVRPFKVGSPQLLEDQDIQVPEDLRVVDTSSMQPVKNADLSKPGKVFTNPMWR